MSGPIDVPVSAPAAPRPAAAAPAEARVPRLVPRIWVGFAFAVLIAAIAAIAAWPIYRSGAFALLVAVGTLVGGGIAAVAWWRRWSGWIVAAALAGAVLLLGVPLAVPSRLGAPDDLLRGLGEVASGLVLGWKDLVTVELPVGSYRNLLVPALVVFLVGTCVLLLLAWRDDHAAYAAVPVALGMVTFGLFFGRTTVSAPLQLGPVTLHAPVETAVGIAGLTTCLLWLAWRTHDERVRALQRAAASSGVRISRRPTAADRRRTALGAGMVVGALVLAVAVVPFAARGAERDVLRSAVGPDIDLSAEVSPLAQYRALFTDDRADEVLFTVEPVADGSAGALPERIRIATLDAYDGQVYRSGGEGAVDAGRFVRVPSALDAGEGEAVEARVEIDAWDGIWMPTAGRLSAIRFAGDTGGVARRSVLLQRRRVGRRADCRGRPRGGRQLRRARGRAADRGPRRARGARQPGGRRRAGQPARVDGRACDGLRRRRPRGPGLAASRARLPQPRPGPRRPGAGMGGSAPRLHVPAERLRALAGPGRHHVRAPAGARDRPAGRRERQLRRGDRRRRAVRGRGGAHGARARLPVARRARRPADVGRAGARHLRRRSMRCAGPHRVDRGAVGRRAMGRPWT